MPRLQSAYSLDRNAENNLRNLEGNLDLPTPKKKNG